MAWTSLQTRINEYGAGTLTEYSLGQYMSDLQEIVSKVNAIQTKLDTVEDNATADMTGDQIITALNSGSNQINFARLNITNGDLSISKTNGLQTALDSKASLVHAHTSSDVTDFASELATKADLVHSHIISDTVLLQATLDGKASSFHQHDHGECVTSYSGLDDDHPKYLSRITRGAPSDANVLETQISYKDGVIPVSANDIPRLIDIWNFFLSGRFGSDSGILDATGNVLVTHNLSTQDFLVIGKSNVTGSMQPHPVDIEYVDDNSFYIKYGSGLDTKSYSYTWISIGASPFDTGSATGTISGAKTGIVPPEGSIPISHYLGSDYVSMFFQINVGTVLSPVWKKLDVDVDIYADGLGFTAHYSPSLAGQQYRIYYQKRLT